MGIVKGKTTLEKSSPLNVKNTNKNPVAVASG